MEAKIREHLFDTDGAATFLTCSAAALVKFRSERRGPPYIRVGKLIRYRPADLVRWVRSQRIAPSQAGKEGVSKR